MLKGEFWSLPVARVKGGGRREPAASAFALDTGAGGIKPELACIRVHLVDPVPAGATPKRRYHLREIKGEAEADSE